MGYGGDAHDYYREESLIREERKRQDLINKMVDLGYDKVQMNEYKTFEIKMMYERVCELKMQKKADVLLRGLDRKTCRESDN